MNFVTIKTDSDIKIPGVNVQFENVDGQLRRIHLITQRGELYTIQREQYGDDLRVLHRETEEAPDVKTEI
jgi:hypothetical protein